MLDECTSAVSIDIEEKLYAAAFDKGITCITVSQKMTLPKFHTQELRFGEVRRAAAVPAPPSASRRCC